MNNFELIKQIRMRPPLWDRVNVDKADGCTREELWDQIALVMGCSKDILKARWKNLRDSYRKLIRKSDQRECDPKWPFYNAMEFMRDITLSARPKVMDITRAKVTLEPDYELTIMRTSAATVTADNSCDSADAKHQQQLKRPHAAGDDLVSHFLEVEADKSHQSSSGGGEDGTRSPRHITDDDDYQFLLSLHPHFKQVAANRKLPLRMKIEQLIYNELYAHGPPPNCSY